ncbi:uncharacterized protein LOC142499928 [Ascaphus truei]|uniref:uncharacterized protein LOC142499928 n=1 Tax=Ascaphus truei TaxID=8439 RepID=UPI003F591C9C
MATAAPQTGTERMEVATEPVGTTLRKKTKKKEKHTAPPETVPSSQETDGGSPAAAISSGSGDVAPPSGLTPTASTSSGGPSSNPGAGSSSNRRIPRLEPWMKQTVVMQLREVDGQRPLLDAETFAKELVSKAGFTPDEILSIQDLRGGLFFVTFATAGACRRYWEAFQTLKQEVPFSEFDVNCPIQRDEKRITVTVRNPHIPGRDIATFLRRFCTVVKEPSRIKDKLGYWVGKWSMVVRLWPNPEAADRLHHLPPSFSLAGSSGRIFYPDQPQTCGNCGNLGHQWKQCTLKACRNCKNTGHETKDCPRQKTCDLCGETTHMFRDCQLGVRSYAEAATKGATPGVPQTATQKAAKKPHANQPVKAQGGKYQKEQSDADSELESDLEEEEEEAEMQEAAIVEEQAAILEQPPSEVQVTVDELIREGREAAETLLNDNLGQTMDRLNQLCEEISTANHASEDGN